MPLYGRLEPFEGDGSAWPIYEEQVRVFFSANDTPEEKQRDIFLASCGTQVLRLLLDLLKPATPHTKTLSELLTTLRSHFSPASSTLMERFRFNNRSRREGESLGQFVAALRCLASTGAFGDQPDSLLRDLFVCGINNPAMQKRLLELPDPSLDDVVKAALAMDAAAKNAGEIARAASTEAEVNKMVARGGICSRCGDAHSRSKCQFSHSQCFTCGKIGHLARVCRTGKPNSGPQQQPGSSPGSTPARGQGRRRKWRRGRAAAGSDSSAARLNVVSEDPLIFDMWHTGLVPSSVPPYMLTVEVCGRPIFMELDTGGCRSWLENFSKGPSPEWLSRLQASCCVATLESFPRSKVRPRNWICALGVRLPEGQEAALHVVQDIPGLLAEFQSLFQPGAAWILFHYRTTPHDVTGCAPCELLLGRMVKTPLNLLHPDLRSTALLKQLKQKLAADKGCCPGSLPEPGVPVFARNFRSGPPWSAGLVVLPASSSSLLVRMQYGTTWHRHADCGTRLASTATPVAASETPTTSQGTGASSCAPLVGPPPSSLPSLSTTAEPRDESSTA
ncbi:hypothetical protein MTO96_047918 [Rhipicephalus appendiculatus]